MLCGIQQIVKENKIISKAGRRVKVGSSDGN